MQYDRFIPVVDRRVPFQKQYLFFSYEAVSKSALPQRPTGDWPCPLVVRVAYRLVAITAVGRAKKVALAPVAL